MTMIVPSVTVVVARLIVMIVGMKQTQGTTP
jgi:hypothetical protein